MENDTTRQSQRAPRLPGGRSTHGLGAIGTLTRVASKARLDRFDKRTAAGRLPHDARRDFEAHLGGVEEISATECALIGRLAMRTLVIALVDEALLRTQANGGTPRDLLEVARCR
jgi:hypothetical protein